MGALLCDAAVTDNDDPVAEFTTAHAMRDVDGRLIPHQRIEIFIDFRFRNRIQCRRGLIQYNKGRILIQGSGNRRLLSLAAGQGNAFAVFVIQKRMFFL